MGGRGHDDLRHQLRLIAETPERLARMLGASQPAALEPAGAGQPYAAARTTPRERPEPRFLGDAGVPTALANALARLTPRAADAAPSNKENQARQCMSSAVMQSFLGGDRASWAVSGALCHKECQAQLSTRSLAVSGALCAVQRLVAISLDKAMFSLRVEMGHLILKARSVSVPAETIRFSRVCKARRRCLLQPEQASTISMPPLRNERDTSSESPARSFSDSQCQDESFSFLGCAGPGGAARAAAGAQAERAARRGA